MAAPELQMNGGFLSVPWAEFVGRDGSHGANWTSGYGPNNRATFEIVVNWEDALQAEIDALGTSYFDPTKGILSRTLPVQHPIKPWMYCMTLVHARPLAWSEKLDSFVTGAQGSSQGITAVSAYQWMHLTFGFEIPPWNNVYSDSQLQAVGGGEWQRFCIVEPDYQQETYSTEIGMWLWADGGGANHPVIDSPLSAEVPIPYPVGKISVKWCRLPRAGLYGSMGASDFFNQNLTNCYGRVNSNPALWGIPANASTGILRFTGLKATPYGSPLAPFMQGLTAGQCNQYYDAHLEFSYMDPPYGNSANRGWNLRPFRGDNLWWLARVMGGNTMFPMADLTQCFQLSAT